MDFDLFKKNKLSYYKKRNGIVNVVKEPELYFEYLKENKQHKKEFYGIFATFSPKLKIEEAINNLNKLDCILWQENLNRDFKSMIERYSISIFGYKINLQKVKKSDEDSIEYPLISEKLRKILKHELSDEYKIISSLK